MDKTLWLSVLGIGGGLLTIAGQTWAYYRRSRTDVEKTKDLNEAEAQTVPLKVLQAALAKRDAEIAESRAQLYTFINNHLEHDRQERDQLIKVMTRTEETMRAIHENLMAHREEEGRRSAENHEDMEAIKLMIASRGKLPNGT